MRKVFRHWLDSSINRAINAGAHAPEPAEGWVWFDWRQKRFISCETRKYHAKEIMMKIDNAPKKRRLFIYENGSTPAQQKLTQRENASAAERFLKDLGL